jgi:hypothetical protein
MADFLAKVPGRTPARRGNRCHAGKYILQVVQD